MKVREAMTREVRLARPDQTIREAASLMAQLDIGALPVEEDDRLIGMITDRDIAVRAVGQCRGPDTPISELMSDGIVCAHEGDDVQAVAQRMSEEQVRRMPVLNSEQNLVGIVSLGDLARESVGQAAEKALEGVSAPGGQHQQ